MDIRIAVYHYSGHQLERLCAATSDPPEIVQAFHGLLDPIPQGKGELALLPGYQAFKLLFGYSNAGWISEAIVGTFHDAAVSPVPARRELIVFTNGSSGTQPKSLDIYASIIDPALAMNTPINPVIMDLYKQQQHITSSAAPNGALSTVDAPKTPDPATSKPGQMSSTWFAGTLPWFNNVGKMTGGQSFVPQHLNREALAEILALVRDTTLSQYVVGFVPDAAAKQKKHSLTVALSSKSKGKLIGGEKNGVAY
jgi:hypothetical protein